MMVGMASGVGNIAFAGKIEAGDDFFQSFGEITLEIFGPGGFIETISVDSMGIPAMVHREELDGPGPTYGFPGDGSFIDTEIDSLDLFGTSVNVGPVHVRVGAGNGVSSPSIGMIEDVVTNGPYDATLQPPSDFVSGTSWFNVFFEIDVIGMGMTFYNQDPHLMGPVDITGLPPYGTTYFFPGEVDLFDKDTDTLVGKVGPLEHTVVPEPSTFLLLGFGLAGIIGFGIRRKKLSKKR
jgi:hypothetical protein